MDDLAQKITNRLDELRIHLQAHGGDVEVVSIEGKTVYVRLQGHCVNCSQASLTIKNGLEHILREELDPEIELVRVD